MITGKSITIRFVLFHMLITLL